MRNSIRCAISLLGLVLPLAAFAATPEVTNIRASQREGTKLIDIRYDVTGTAPLTVEVHVYDGDTTLPTFSLSGDVGHGVEPGLDRQIVWNAGQDWNRRFTDDARARIVVDDMSPTPPNNAMVFVPGGFGTPTGASYEIYTSGFYMDRYEVSKELWDEVYDWGRANGYDFDNAGYADGSDHPVSGINWYDAIKWCNARSEKEGLAPAYYTDSERTEVYRTGQVVLDNNWVSWEADGYRLPSVAEWAKAYWGGKFSGHFYWPSFFGSDDENIHPGLANYLHSRGTWSRDTMPVGYFDGNQEPPGPDNPNEYGLYDMAGNVGEWCWDRELTGWFTSYDEARDDNSKGPNFGTGMNRAWSGSIRFTEFRTQYYEAATTTRSPPDTDGRWGTGYDSTTAIGLRSVRGQ